MVKNMGLPFIGLGLKPRNVKYPKQHRFLSVASSGRLRDLRVGVLLLVCQSMNHKEN